MRIIILLIFIIISNSIPTFSQTDWKSNRQQVRLGLGVLPFDLETRYYYLINGAINETYPGNHMMLPCFNLTYTFQLKKWLAVGALVSYTREYQSIYSLRNDRPVYKWHKNYSSFIPIVRFDWFRRNLVTLYSNIGIGLTLETQSSKNLVSKDKNNYVIWYISPQISPLGITVGKRIYGFGEVGIGIDGIVKAGVGYKFNL